MKNAIASVTILSFFTCTVSIAGITESIPQARHIFDSKPRFKQEVVTADLSYYAKCTKLALTAAAMEIRGTNFNESQSISYALMLVLLEKMRFRFISEGYSENAMYQMVTSQPEPTSNDITICLAPIANSLSN